MKQQILEYLGSRGAARNPLANPPGEVEGQLTFRSNGLGQLLSCMIKPKGWDC